MSSKRDSAISARAPHDLDVRLEHPLHAGAEHLEDNRRPVLEHRGVGLGHGGRGERVELDRLEVLVDPPG